MAEIKRILIANRGEIALRAIRTIKEMGKEAVAVYSTADKDAHYLKLADAAICIGGPKAHESYLNIPAIISAAELAECDAVFPGYGFLSENQNFVEICGHHGLKFIGPGVDVMQMMADKSKAKQVMAEAGVPTIPGSDGAVPDAETAKKLAKEIGYPVILKAAAGGGGRGMRVVEDESYIENAFLACEAEAVNAFADGTLYMEKFIEAPRHVEVQVMGDSHGNAIHIGERDCSMQRRHQKLIEESPALVLDEARRQELLEAAVRATKHIGYEGAGTFEFLVDKHKNFYFMEMNTRLQVEHCVSEMVSGIDIIEWMIRVAEGEALPSQEEITLKGHAIECRITAEDPVSFLPSPGKIQKWIAPGGKDVRIDTHAYCNYIIPTHYDSMIGKLIVWGENRDRAIAKMRRALDEFEVGGVRTVIEFHRKMMRNEDFISNNFDTKYLEDYKG
ncbi:MAG TPA: acetyl-CoA carboxylase biotin carboxylase subunit [Nitratifractor salsuginis]|uniref:Biotin carboxylase n=1 Tax=Nitratifractor salsuginis TaxID=269261 RepID=A0A7V2WM11_9BACT|nr:acetyl-CoA carboxylase biotin carboxylase subunit [Nitratifractor salsuginis]